MTLLLFAWSKTLESTLKPTPRKFTTRSCISIFLIHLKGLEQSPADMTAVERFVADKVWGKAKNVGNINVEWLPNTTWMPRSTKDNDHQHIQVEPDCNDCMHAQMDKLMN